MIFVGKNWALELPSFNCRVPPTFDASLICLYTWLGTVTLVTLAVFTALFTNMYYSHVRLRSFVSLSVVFLLLLKAVTCPLQVNYLFLLY